MTTEPDTDEIRLLLHAYMDGELDAASAFDIERRLAGIGLWRTNTRAW